MVIKEVCSAISLEWLEGICCLLSSECTHYFTLILRNKCLITEKYYLEFRVKWTTTTTTT